MATPINVKLNVQQLLSLLAILALESLNSTTVHAISTGEKLLMEGDDIGKIVNAHNDLRARENPSGNIQTIVSVTPINCMCTTLLQDKSATAMEYRTSNSGSELC